MSAAGEVHLFRDLEAICSRAVAIRHDLHRHPELGYQEHYTSAAVCRELDRLGVPYKKGLAGGTGILATIKGAGGGTGGGCVALRADMDALPIHEETGAAYASESPGRMHACGHDGHTAILLGTAAVLAGHTGAFAGTIQLLFQPAEEGGLGAKRMVEDGVLENPKVDAIFGLHGWPGLKVGIIATRPGPLLASVDGFTIRITGRGGHAAAPQDSVDPIVCAAAIVQSLQTIVSREADPTEASVLTISQINAGTAFNVIPDRAELHGTIRALCPARRKATIDSLERMSKNIAIAHRCEAAITYYGTTPVTHNTPELAAFIRQIATQTLGAAAFVEAPKPAMWGEDFAFYLERVPGCFFVLGVQPQDQGSYPMLHSPRYDFTDAAIPVGIRMMATTATEFLKRPR